MRLGARVAEEALRAVRGACTTRDPFSDNDDRLDANWGYEVQALDRKRRTSKGERVVGVKLGLTSEAKQRRMGVHTPIVGFLTDAMVLEADIVRPRLENWAQPRIEPEIAFVTARPISEAVAREDVAGVVDSVCVAAEIIDSRYTDYRFGLADVIADNTSAAGMLTGPARRLAEIDYLAGLACSVVVDGIVVHEAFGSAVLGDPLRAVVLVSEHLAGRGEVLPAGAVILAGAMTDAVPLVAGGSYRLGVEGLGEVRVDL